MIVKDEERDLQKCLTSARDVAEEIVIVDTGSTDSTVEIARHNGARLIHFDFAFVDFAAARNAALSQAKGDWILVLDADETLQQASVELIRELTAGRENVGYYAARHNHSANPEVSTLDYAVRLFRNQPENRYRGRVHETVDAAILAGGGHLHRSEIHIDHNFRCDPESRRRRNLWYIEILQEEIAANPDDHTRLDFLAAEYHQLEMFDEAAAIAERIAEARPLDPSAHLNAGIYHLIYLPDPARARADFLEALRLRPDYPEAKAFLAKLEGDCEQSGSLA